MAFGRHSVFFYFVLLSCFHGYEFAKSVRHTITPDHYKDGKCESKFVEVCTVDVSDGSLKGPQGEKGEKGDSGRDGYGGLPGIAGPRGYPGLQGEKGDMGPGGFPGMMGIKGEKGDTAIGPKGPPGDVGPTGRPGRKGSVGRPGSCPCFYPPSTPATTDEDDTDMHMGDEGLSLSPDTGKKKTMPLASCRAFPGLSTGNYWIGLQNPFEVYCDQENNQTCLITRIHTTNEKSIQKKFVKHGNEPFWLSERPKNDNPDEEYGFDLEEFYGVTLDQLEWLQGQSSFVTQEIRYHCKNSKVISSDVHSSLHLLSWKDGLIGPNATFMSPLHYDLIHDGCKETKEPAFTDIHIESGHKRLPVIDFHIRDIRDEEQQFYTELKKLCFG